MNTPLKTILCTFALGLLPTLPLYAGPDVKSSLTPPPPMGWNSWNWLGKKDLNEKIIRDVIDSMVSSGLRDAGFRYLIVDGGWRTSNLGDNGRLQVHPEKFPSGIKALSDYAHSKGMKFGLHTVPGTHDCGGDQVGGFLYEKVHVKQFADWGCDFVKVDMCLLKGVLEKKEADAGNGWSEAILEETYGRWRTELDAVDKDIVLSISAYKYRDWYPKSCRIARTTYDIRAKVHKGGAQFDQGRLSVMGIAHENNKYAKHAGNGYWNDPDMLAVGEQGLTVEEQKTHFALWCIMSSPLMLGNDPRNMTAEELAMLTNADAIAVDQDTTEQGVLIKTEGNIELWAKKLTQGRIAVLLINRHTETETTSLKWSDLKLKGSHSVKDIYKQTKLPSSDQSIDLSLPAHGCAFLLISPQ